MGIIGGKLYEFNDHLGNVRVVISDKKNLEQEDLGTYDDNGILTSTALDGILEEYFTPDVVSFSDYYPFGSNMRRYQSASYRYGFNGKEQSNDMGNAAGAVYDYGFRIYDSRIAKFTSVDPLAPDYPYYSPYHFAGNNPVRFIDLDGLEPVIGQIGQWDKKPALKKEWYPNVKNLKLYESKGYEGNVIVAKAWNSEGEAKYYWLDNNKWKIFNPFEPIAAEVSEIAIKAIAYTGGAIVLAEVVVAAGLERVTSAAYTAVSESAFSLWNNGDFSGVDRADIGLSLLGGWTATLLSSAIDYDGNKGLRVAGVSGGKKSFGEFAIELGVSAAFKYGGDKLLKNISSKIDILNNDLAYSNWNSKKAWTMLKSTKLSSLEKYVARKGLHNVTHLKSIALGKLDIVTQQFNIIKGFNLKASPLMQKGLSDGLKSILLDDSDNTAKDGK
jgi:RHS repeat-associated protein